MYGVEKAHCNAAIKAIITAFYALSNSTIEEALRSIWAYGKSDTLGMDAMPEITIVDQLKRYDKMSIIITEESSPKEPIFTEFSDPRRYRTVFISDPTDRSKYFKSFLTSIENKKLKVMDILKDPKTRIRWEEQYGHPAEITGSASAISCVRRGIPIFSLIVNYITCQLFISCAAGNYMISLPEQSTKMDLDYIIKEHGERLFFRDIDYQTHDAMRKFVTFMGKSGYRENFLDSGFIDEKDLESLLHYHLPGGPLRILYLSTLQPADNPVGFILANGEKITEWIHWIPFVRFAQKENDQSEMALKLYEVYQDRPWTKDGVLMATPPAYSIFRRAPNDLRMLIDVNRFADFSNPSKIRATLLVAPRNNHWATRAVNQYGYRPIEILDE